MQQGNPNARAASAGLLDFATKRRERRSGQFTSKACKHSGSQHDSKDCQHLCLMCLDVPYSMCLCHPSEYVGMESWADFKKSARFGQVRAIRTHLFGGPSEMATTPSTNDETVQVCRQCCGIGGAYWETQQTMPTYVLPSSTIPVIELRQKKDASLPAFDNENRDDITALDDMWRDWETRRAAVDRPISSLDKFLEQTPYTARVAFYIPLHTHSDKQLAKKLSENMMGSKGASDNLAETTDSALRTTVDKVHTVGEEDALEGVAIIPQNASPTAVPSASSSSSNAATAAAAVSSSSSGDSAGGPPQDRYAKLRLQQELYEDIAVPTQPYNGPEAVSSFMTTILHMLSWGHATSIEATVLSKNLEKPLRFSGAAKVTLVEYDTTNYCKICLEGGMFTELERLLSIVTRNGFYFALPNHGHGFRQLNFEEIHFESGGTAAAEFSFNLRERIMTEELDICNVAIELLMAAKCNYDLTSGEHFRLLDEHDRKSYKTADLPWKLPNTVVEMLSGQMQPHVWPSENARKSTAADQKYIAQRNSFVKVRSPENSLMLNKNRARENNSDSGPLCVEKFDVDMIQHLLNTHTQLDTHQQGAVLNAFNANGLSAVQGPLGTGKTNIIAHIVILGTAAYDITCQDDSLNARMERLYTARAAPLFLVVTATNSAADHVALAIKKLAKDMAKAPHQNYQGKRLGLGNVVLMRKYSKLVPTSAVPQELFSCSNKDQGRKFDPQKINCIVMTMGHAKAFKYLSRVCPHMIIFEEASMANLFEFFGVCCRFDMNTNRAELLDKCRELRHQRPVHSVPVSKPSTARVAKDLQEDASDDDCWVDEAESKLQERTVPKIRYTESGRVFNIVSIGDICQLDNKPFVIPKGVEASRIASEWLCDQQLVHLLKRKLVGSVHDIFIRNLDLKQKTFLENVYRGCAPLYRFGLDWLYNSMPPLTYMPQGNLKSVVEKPALSPLHVLSPVLRNIFTAVLDVQSQSPPAHPSARAPSEALCWLMCLHLCRTSIWFNRRVSCRTWYMTSLFKIALTKARCSHTSSRAW